MALREYASGGLFSRQHLQAMPKNYKIKQTTCSHCGAEKPGNELFQYVDGNNAAITRNSPLLCRSCYAKQYPDLY